jgi:hypothetical protein
VAPIDFAKVATARNSSMFAVGHPTVSEPDVTSAQATAAANAANVVASAFILRTPFKRLPNVRQS